MTLDERNLTPRRALIVVESPLDAFGPPMQFTDEFGFTAREMVPAEANQKEMYRELDPLAAPWQKPSKDMLQTLLRESDDRVRSR